MKILASTFGKDDFDKVVQAMRRLPYEQLVLIGDDESSETASLKRLKDLEEMAGHRVIYETVSRGGFMDIVEEVSDVIEKHAKADDGRRNDLILNISGGSKLLGDAALLAAFRSGVETYHCDEKLTKLPVLKGLSAKDMFTPSQVRFIMLLRGAPASFDALVESISPGNRHPVERVMRELKKAGLIETEVKQGKITVSLSGPGDEVARAIKVA